MINRLKHLSVYLSGPIDAAKNLGREWREDISEFLSSRFVQIISPLKPVFYGNHNVDSEKHLRMKKMQSDGDFEHLEQEMYDLSRCDLRAVDISSFLIVNYDMSTVMCGTYEEMFRANQQDKPVLLVASEGKKNMPLWMFGRFPVDHMFDDWDSLKQYLKNIDQNPFYVFSDADIKRWWFFNGSHMTPMRG